MNNGSIILQCSCYHPQQDALHGTQMRVHNYIPTPSDKPDIVRCTVCGAERTPKTQAPSAKS